MPYRYGKRKAIRTRRPVKRVPRKRSGGRKAITKIVKSIISRQAENKSWFDYGANQSIITVVGSTPSNKQLIPLVSQGTGHSQRIGNEIRVKSGYIRGHVNILPFENITNPQPLPLYVKMWVVSCRAENNTSLASTDIGNSFFDIVNSSVGFQGNMLDIDFTPNKDSWTIYATKTVKLGAGFNTSTGPVTSLSYFDNSPMSVPFYFNIGKHMKTVKYSDNAVPTNKNMFIVFQAVPANGATANGSISAEFHYSTRVEYEDM